VSAHHLYELSCDAGGCSERFADASVRAGEARRNAGRVGWLHVLTPPSSSGPWTALDFCPAHRDAQPRHSKVVPC
jgi:hypothetical protein